MSKCRLFQILLEAALAISLPACVVESKNPLSDPDRSLSDPDLFGTWVKEHGGGETTLLVIGRADDVRRSQKDVPAGIMRLVQSSIDSKGFVGTPSSEVFFVTSFGKEGYFNIFSDSALDTADNKSWDKRRIETYRLVKYRVSEDKLELWSGDPAAVGRLVESGKLRGEVSYEDNDPNKSVVSGKFTDTTANLLEFFGNGGGEVVFPDDTKEVFVRMRVP